MLQWKFHGAGHLDFNGAPWLDWWAFNACWGFALCTALRPVPSLLHAGRGLHLLLVAPMPPHQGHLPLHPQDASHALKHCQYCRGVCSSSRVCPWQHASNNSWSFHPRLQVPYCDNRCVVFHQILWESGWALRVWFQLVTLQADSFVEWRGVPWLPPCRKFGQLCLPFQHLGYCFRYQ